MPTLTESAIEEIRERGRHSLYPTKTKIAVGMSTSGRASGAEEVIAAIQSATTSLGLDVMVTPTGCLGLCQREPLVDLIRPGWPRIVYQQMDVKKAKEIVAALAEERILDILIPPVKKTGTSATEAEADPNSEAYQNQKTREWMREKLKKGEMDDKMIEFDAAGFLVKKEIGIRGPAYANNSR